MRLTSQTHVIYGLTAPPPWVVNAGFITGKSKTLVVDAGWNSLSAQTIYGYTQAVNPLNDLILVNTEPHSDHMGGNCFFHEMGTPIYGIPGGERHDSELTGIIAEFNASVQDVLRRQQNEGRLPFKHTRLVNPDHPVTHKTVLDLGGIEAHLIPTPGHTPYNLSVFCPQEKVLFCGDIIVEAHQPNLENDTSEARQNWRLSLEIIQSLNPDIVVPGHGQALSGKELSREIDRIFLFLQES